MTWKSTSYGSLFINLQVPIIYPLSAYQLGLFHSDNALNYNSPSKSFPRSSNQLVILSDGVEINFIS